MAMRKKMSGFSKLDKQLVKRKQEQLLSRYCSLGEKGEGPQFLMSESDWGVSRNGGRPGARFAPQAILHCLGKMVAHTDLSWQAHSISLGGREREDFSKAQEDSCQMISKHLRSRHLTVHLGGGHDHIYPLLMALEKGGGQKITVLNIDAHCDTRPDPLPHSGTPFRQFDHMTKTEFKLIQLGIHRYANTQETLAPLKKGKMIIHEGKNLPRDFSSMGKFLEETLKVDTETDYVISLDCDALSSAFMEGVSAVNPEGMNWQQVRGIFHWAYTALPPTRTLYGLYEYNPVYDNLSEKGAKALAALIYETCF